MCQLWQIKENIKYNPFDDISISFNPLYVKENSHNKFTSFHWLICNAEWKFFNSFWLLKQNTFSQSCANSVTKSKRTLLKNAWFTAVECLNSLRTWRSRGHFKSSEDYYCALSAQREFIEALQEFSKNFQRSNESDWSVPGGYNCMLPGFTVWTVLVKKYTPCQGMIWFSLTNVISFTLVFMWLFN